LFMLLVWQRWDTKSSDGGRF